MPQNKDTYIRKRPFLAHILLIMWFERDVLPINLANVSVTQTPRTMMIAMTLVWMTVKESMTSCKTSWLWLP